MVSTDNMNWSTAQRLH